MSTTKIELLNKIRGIKISVFGYGGGQNKMDNGLIGISKHDPASNVYKKITDVGEMVKIEVYKDDVFIWSAYYDINSIVYINGDLVN